MLTVKLISSKFCILFFLYIKLPFYDWFYWSFSSKLCFNYNYTVDKAIFLYLCKDLRLQLYLKGFFLGIYIEAVDHYGHRYGVGSKELKDMIKKVDDEIYNLIKQMTSLGLDDVSLMVFSDHGMANIQETVDLSKTLDMEDVTALIPEGSTVKIWPKPGLIDKVN